MTSKGVRMGWPNSLGQGSFFCYESVQILIAGRLTLCLSHLLDRGILQPADKTYQKGGPE